MGELQTNGYINGSTDGNHLIGLGSAPTVVLGPGAGAGSAIITGTDNGFTISVTIGAGNTNNSIVFTVTFNTAFLVIPQSIFAAKNANAAASNARMWNNNLSTTQMTLNVTNPALTTGQVYVWSFITL